MIKKLWLLLCLVPLSIGAMNPRKKRKMRVGLSYPPRKEQRAEQPIDIHQAVLAGNYERVKKAIKQGVQMHAFDDNDYTPLMLAVDEGNPQMVQLLLESGADPIHSSFFGLTPKVVAVMNGNQPIVTLLEEHEKRRKDKARLLGLARKRNVSLQALFMRREIIGKF